MSSGVPVQYTPSHEVTRADDGAQLAWGTDGSLTSRTFGTDVTSYASDLLGRRTSTTTASGDVTSFSWDQVGRLTGVGDTASGSATDYTYAGGLRVGAETTTGEDTTSEAFAWDTLAGVPLLLADGAHEYIYALGSAPVAQVDTVTGVVTFLHGDLVGSTRAATDASGTVVGTWDYSMFGVTTAATGGAAGDGAGVTRFLFAGEYLDDTGLYYLRARFYDPVTASFLSVDPALAQTGSPYAYAAGNPLQMVDPLGLNPWDNITNSIKNAVKRVTSWEDVGDYLVDADCEIFGGFFGDVSNAIGNLRDSATPANIWRLTRFALNSNGVRDPLGAAYGWGVYGLAEMSGADCAMATQEMMLVCADAPSWLHGRGGTMHSFVFVTSEEAPDDFEGTNLDYILSDVRTLAHEAKHMDQFAIFGAGPFGISYGLTTWGEALLGTVTGVSHPSKCAVFERWAGFTDGGYTSCAG